MAIVMSVAVTQSHHYAGWWDGLGANPVVQDFVRDNATGEQLDGNGWFR